MLCQEVLYIAYKKKAGCVIPRLFQSRVDDVWGEGSSGGGG